VSNRDTQPALLISHLPVLCHVRQCGLLSLLVDGEALGKLVKMKSAVAIGVPKVLRLHHCVVNVGLDQ
jgi:hypothetical protein